MNLKRPARAADGWGVDAATILSLLRPLVLVVDGFGQVLDARGGYGGFLGHEPDALVGSNVFDFVAPSQVDEIATYFVESGNESLDTVSLPLPFRVDLVGADGLEYPVDVIPTACEAGSELWGWVATLVPVALNASATRSLDAEMTGRQRDEVRTLLADEVTVDNAQYSTRGFLVDRLDGVAPQVTSGRSDDHPMVAAVELALAGGWRPWDGVAHGDTAALAVDHLPATVRAVARDRNWRRVMVTPVHLDGQLVAAYVLFGQVPADYPLDEVKTNVKSRMRNLVDYTALIIGRWRERDRLMVAATHDSLTGLANRDAFSDALAVAGRCSAVLYVDVDNFKSVNDRYGHQVGDRVLVEIASRVAGACRPDDVVARFGGDEFVVLLREADHAQAQRIGERVIAAVGAPIELPDGPERITVSVGLAPYGEGADMVDVADRAMLAAKRGGRDRLVTA